MWPPEAREAVARVTPGRSSDDINVAVDGILAALAPFLAAMEKAAYERGKRDAAPAEAAELLEALKDLASFLPDLDSASRYLRRIRDMRPAMEHAAILIAAQEATRDDR